MALRAGGGSARLVRDVGSAGSVAGFRARGPLRGARLTTGLSATYPQRAGDGVARQRVVSAYIYAVIYPSALGEPSAAQIKAGQNVNSSAATWAGSIASPTSTQTVDWPSLATGLTAGTSYKVSFVWSDGTLDSAPETSSAFSTTSAGVAGSIEESPTLSDTLAAAADAVGAVDESLTATDALAGGLAAVATVAESASATDTLSGVAAVGGSVSESVSLTDTIDGDLAGASVSGSISESASITDALSGAGVLAGALTEAPTVTDALGGALAGGGTIAEAPTLSDALSGAAVLAGAIAEAPTLSDAIDGDVSGAVVAGSISESVSLTDALGGSAAMAGTLSEPISLADVAGASGSQTVTITEPLTVADVLSAQGGSDAQPIVVGGGLRVRPARRTDRGWEVIEPEPEPTIEPPGPSPVEPQPLAPLVERAARPAPQVPARAPMAASAPVRAI